MKRIIIPVLAFLALTSFTQAQSTTNTKPKKTVKPIVRTSVPTSTTSIHNSQSVTPSKPVTTTANKPVIRRKTHKKKHRKSTPKQ